MKTIKGGNYMIVFKVIKAFCIGFHKGIKKGIENSKNMKKQ